MSKVSLFAEITKAEEQSDGTIEVMGYASSEAKDAQGEVVKAAAIAAAIPDFMKYGTGNLREMHQPIAVGTVPFMKVMDDGRTEIHAHVVDSETCKKVKAGVLKGFSIGGSVSERDEADKSVIKGVRLSEISLVDRPANPEAVITFFKVEDASGAAEQAVDELAKLLNDGFDPARLLLLAKGAVANSAHSAAEPAEDVAKLASAELEADMRKLADELGTPTLHSLHLALAEGLPEGDARTALADAVLAIGDDAAKGDFHGHPFRGNQHTGGASGGSSSKAVHASQKAKHAEKQGGKGSKSAHKEAARSHKAALKELKGKEGTKSYAYHSKMAEFHSAQAKGGSEKSEGTGDLSKAGAIAVLKKYAGQEIDDASQAMDALRTIRWVLSSELGEMENEPEQVQSLLDALDAIKDFIVSELGEDTMMEDKAAKPSTLQKLQHSAQTGADARLAKAVEGMAKSVAELRKEIGAKDVRIDELTKAIGNLPTAPKGGEMFVISKGGQIEGELIVKNADGSTNQEATATAQIRKARQEAGLPC